MKKEKRLGFDPGLEPKYLARFSGVAKREQLEIQLSTALSELFLSEYTQERYIDGEEVRDKKTGLSLRDMAKNNPYEVRALTKIKSDFDNGAEVIVNISPKNENFDYPDNMVDIWKRGDGNKVWNFRFKVDMEDGNLRKFYKVFGGIENLDKEEILANPVRVEGYRLAEVIQILSLSKEKEKDGWDILKIDGVVKKIVSRFQEEFGKEIFVDSELITRLFVSARLEIEEKKSESGGVVTRRMMKDEERRLQNYMYGELKIERKAGSGCGGSSLGGQFASEGIIIIKTADGISFRKGSTEGLTYCSRCGCWYSGEKCPICK